MGILLNEEQRNAGRGIIYNAKGDLNATTLTSGTLAAYGGTLEGTNGGSTNGVAILTFGSDGSLTSNSTAAPLNTTWCDAPGSAGEIAADGPWQGGANYTLSWTVYTFISGNDSFLSRTPSPNGSTTLGSNFSFTLDGGDDTFADVRYTIPYTITNDAPTQPGANSVSGVIQIGFGP